MAITLLIFIPLYYSVNSFFLSSADEIINSWYQSERTSMQQGNILSSISKLQRPITNSILLKGIIVKDENGHDLLKMGQNFNIDQQIQISNHGPQYTRTGFSRYVYQFSESGVMVYILVGSYLHYVVAVGFAVYLIILFFIFGYFIRREATILEKMKNESELESMKLKMELDKKFLIMSQQVAHDIRSPLAALNVVSSQIQDSSNESSEMKNILKISIQRINDISNDLLKQVKATNAKPELRQTALDKIVEDIITEKNIILTNKNMKPISFSKDFLKGVTAEIIPQELSRVLSNLLNNSIEAVDKQTGVIKISGKYDANFIVLTISDNGKGIPSSVLSKLGELGASFGKNNENGSGSGIGLYHAKKTMELFGGNLNIESEENKETNLILKLPCIISQPENNQTTRQIILFEDDELVKMTWEFKAKKMGLTLSTFATFEGFMKVHQSSLFSLSTPIYSDVNLSPTESGLDVVKKLNNLGFNNIHLCTGYNRNSITVPDFIKSVSDKNFPANL
jgi:signal transduction histidine kinase